MSINPSVFSSYPTLGVFLVYFLDFLALSIPRFKRHFPQNVQKILLVKLDHLGDSLLFTSILPEIAKKYPKAQIDLVCSAYSQTIYERNPAIHVKYTFEHFALNRRDQTLFQKLKKHVQDMRRLLPILRRTKYDLCVMGRPYLGNGLLFCWLVGARFLIGYGTLGMGRLCDRVVPWGSAEHEIENFSRLLKAMEIEVNPRVLKSELYPTAEDKAVALRVMEDASLGAFIWVMPGAGTADRAGAVSVIQWVDLILAYSHPEWTVALAGVSGDFQIIEALAEALVGHRRVVKLVSRLSVHQVLEVMKCASQILCLDSLGAHLAAMTSVPTVALYVYQKPKRDLAVHVVRWRPWREDVVLLTDPAWPPST